MRVTLLSKQRAYLLWSAIGFRELWHETKADLHNKSVFFAIIALVVLPVDLLPALYADWMNMLNSLPIHSNTVDRASGYEFCVAIFIGLLTTSFYRQNLFSDLSQINLLENTLPVPRFNRALNKFLLGMHCHLPFLLVALMGAAAAIIEGRAKIQNLGHIFTFFSYMLMSALATGLTIIWCKLKIPDFNRKKVVRHARFNYRLKSVAWLLFLTKRLFEQDFLKQLSFLAFICLVSFIFYQKDNPDLVSHGTSLTLLISAMCSYYLLWILKPLLSKRKTCQSLLLTTPSILSATLWVSAS